MFKTYLRIAFRNLWKRKTTTAINVSGLAVGLASCALVFLYIQHELSFDKDFDDGGNIYRITSTFGDGRKAPTVGLPYALYLKNEIPEIAGVAHGPYHWQYGSASKRPGNEHAVFRRLRLLG